MTVEVGRRLTLRADPPTAHLTASPIVGRERELTTLRDALYASEVDGRTIVVGGDAGTGKSALLAAFRTDVQHAGIRVLEGACVEIESRRPFGVFADLVSASGRAFGAERVERCLAERGVNTRQFLSPEASATTRPGDRYQVHGAILGLLTDLSGDGPLATFIEDLHWADAASLELFGYLARRLRSRPVLLVATYRTDELDRRHPLRPALADLRRARLIEDLPLSPLDIEGSGELIHARLGLREPAPLDLREFRELVHARCEGNPLHTEEALDTLRQRGDLRFADGAWSCETQTIRAAVPTSIADDVIARWAGLTPSTQQVLLVAAVAGHRFDLELVAAVSGTPAHALAPLIHEAIDARLLREGTADRSLTFRHALTREALLQQLLRSERFALHGKIAAFLQRPEAVSVRAAELAYHLEESGNAAKASRYHEAAARDAAARTDYASAARSMERAIATAADGDAEQAGRQMMLVDYLRRGGDDPRARRAAASALELGERNGDARLQGGALLAHYELGYTNSEEMPGQEPLDRALHLLEPLGPTAELSQICSAMAAASARQGDGVAALAMAERARQVATVLALPAELAWGTLQVAIGQHAQGRIAESVATCREAVELAKRAGLVNELYGALMTLRVQLYAAGASSDEQRDTLLQMREVARAAGLGNQQWIVRELAFLHRDADWDGFLRLLPEVPEPHRPDAQQARLMAMFTAVAREGPGQLEDLDRARLPAAYRNSAPEADWAAEVLLLAGRPHDAVELALTVHDDETRRRYWGLIPASIVHAIGLFAARECGDESAREQFISSLLTERPMPVSPAFNRRHIALAKADNAERAGRVDAALAAYAVTLAECERSQYNNAVMYLMSLIRQRRAELHLRLSPRNILAAQAELDGLLPYWQKAKATWYLGQLREWAEQLGLAFPSSPEEATAASAPRQLTRRELEIARLVAQGLTNREIGGRLSLSVRTAEGHVEQIRSKLGFKTRAQIASWVTERYGANR